MTKTTKLVLTASALFLALYVGRPEDASAAGFSANANVHVSALVTPGCTITASPLDFGTYDPFGAQSTSPLDVHAPLTYACTNLLTATISLGSGGARVMKNGASNLTYEIYTKSDYTTVWGGTTTVGVKGTGASATVEMYGRIPQAQTLLVEGTYSQDIQATINF